MKQLILVRHGSCTGGVLNTDGITKMRVLQDVLRERFYPFVVFTSEAKTAQESAAMLIRASGGIGPLTCVPFLYADASNPCDPPKLIELLKTTDAERVVVVTHYEWIVNFPYYVFALHGWRIEKESPVLGYGDALVIDFDRQSCEMLQPTAASV